MVRKKLLSEMMLMSKLPHPRNQTKRPISESFFFWSIFFLTRCSITERAAAAGRRKRYKEGKREKERKTKERKWSQ